MLSFGLTGKQELPVRRDDGDAVVPVVALRGWRQARQHGVAVLLTADEDLTAGVGILGDVQKKSPENKLRDQQKRDERS